MSTPADIALTPAEKDAQLKPEELSQLVGLVNYDSAEDPFPVTG